ncbi:hypothetical protein PR202_ga07614 [Eleusine coracana subsp. coracana]|uniref:HIT-type domain-containing protein n=1 Tax=Eleusine coracana subsp. coracana TaxID=191504 RepID=A0AAV5C021_ELECO|nr:hypothetical protein PR202_ga07614 [Eleusine coracana subsp. coracana]
MERDVVISEHAAASSASSSSSSSFAETRVICRVCQKQFAQYTCPRCNTRYCSLPCYKGAFSCGFEFPAILCQMPTRQAHVGSFDISSDNESVIVFNALNPSCERMFWMSLSRCSLKMNRRRRCWISSNGSIWKKTESDGEDESTLSDELIQKVMSGEELKLEDLSDDEIKRFRQALASGELSKMIEPWTPWWKKQSSRSIYLSPDGSQLIREVTSEDTSMPDPMTDQEPSINENPEGPESALPSLKQLTKAEPSPLLAVHLVDILYSYCFTLRLYNGDWRSDPFGASSVAMSMSKVMGEDTKPETVPEALTACIEETCSPAYRHTGGFRFAIGLVDDIITLLSLGHNALVCALCDFRRLIQAGESMLKSAKVGKAEKTQSSLKLRAATRKLYFMTCWVHEQPNEAWPSLARIVEVHKASLEELDSGSRTAGRKSNPQSKVLIEEL